LGNPGQIIFVTKKRIFAPTHAPKNFEDFLQNISLKKKLFFQGSRGKNIFRPLDHQRKNSLWKRFDSYVIIQNPFLVWF